MFEKRIRQGYSVSPRELGHRDGERHCTLAVFFLNLHLNQSERISERHSEQPTVRETNRSDWRSDVGQISVQLKGTIFSLCVRGLELSDHPSATRPSRSDGRSALRSDKRPDHQQFTSLSGAWRSPCIPHGFGSASPGQGSRNSPRSVLACRFRDVCAYESFYHQVDKSGHGSGDT